MMRISLHRAALAAGAGVLALCLASCGERLTNAAGPAAGTALRLNMRASVVGGTSDALAKVDAAHVRVTFAGVLLLDTTVAYGSEGIDLTLRLPDPAGTVVVALELTYHSQVLFRGGGSAEAQRGTETRIPLTVTPVVAGVAAPDSVVLSAVGDSTRVRGAAVFASGDTIPEATIAWTGDGGGVIRVSTDGMVTALREGQGQATASYQSFSRTMRVRVQAVVTRLTLSADTFSLFVDSTRTLSAVARDRNGNVLQRTIAWRSSSPAVATVDANGLVRAVAPGTATITASSEAQSASATVTVRRIPVASVRVTPASATLLVGETVALSATTLDASGKVLTGRSVTWSSSNPRVATVDTAGLVRAVAVGSATITATSENQSGSAAIQVVLPAIAVSLQQVSFSAPQGSLPAPQSVAVTNAGGGTLSGLAAAVTYPVGGPTGWLSVSLSSTTAPATLTLTPGSSNLPAGTYSATVTVSSAVAGVVAVQVPVQLVVQSPQPIIGASLTSVTFHMRTDTLGYPVSTTGLVFNAGGGTLDGLSVTVLYGPYGTDWLTTSLSSTTAPATLTLTAQGYVSIASPPYTATVTISSNVPGAGTKTITVTYSP